MIVFAVKLRNDMTIKLNTLYYYDYHLLSVKFWNVKNKSVLTKKTRDGSFNVSK